MRLDFSKLGKEFVQGVLAAGGFGALTLLFAQGKVSTEVYVPLVALMVGFFFTRPQTPAVP